MHHAATITQAELDQLGELVLSPSFLVRAEGKKPRAILHLSSTDKGVNQRLVDELEAHEDGYSTIKSISTEIVKTFVSMVLTPGKYHFDDICGTELSLIVMDADSAFFRCPAHEDIVGMQCARIKDHTMVLLCCSFGWKRSAEEFSHITAGIRAAYKSELGSATLVDKAVGLTGEVKSELNDELTAFIQEKNPQHSHCIPGSHVDDYVCLEILRGNRPSASASDLAFAIKLFLGHNGLSLKKFVVSSLWSDLQKVIGGWFDVDTFTVTMPKGKIADALAILNSDELASHQVSFSIDLIASLVGKLNWCTYTSALGSPGCLINICKQRRAGEQGGRKVRPASHHGESSELTLAKFHNDMSVRRRFLEAAADNPRIVTCSMVSVMSVDDRLCVPGQSKWLVWLSGDFSLEGNSYGIEFWHPELGNCKWWSFIRHPDNVVKALRVALAGKAGKHQAVVSSVLERQNKLYAEFQWRKILAGRPVIILDDNTGSVASAITHYSANVHLPSGGAA